MGNQQLHTADVYMEYVTLRKAGTSSEDAVSRLQGQAKSLTRGEREQLGQLVQAWEGREGKHFKPIAKSQSDSVSVSQEDEPAPQDKQAVRKQHCPNCGKANKMTESYCYACGHILDSMRPQTKNLEDDGLDPRTRWGTAHFLQSSMILLTVSGVPRPIEVSPKDEVVIGRAEVGSSIKPDVDLGPYDAEELGVSRLHASIKRLENTISLIDMDSKNHTYINGQRLHSHEVRVLRDGDEIRLGRLKIQVKFKHPIKPIGMKG